MSATPNASRRHFFNIGEKQDQALDVCGVRGQKKRFHLLQQGEEMNAKLKEFIEQAGGVELDTTVVFTNKELERFESLIRADQRATDAVLAFNFPFSPVIGKEIAKLIRCWRDA